MIEPKIEKIDGNHIDITTGTKTEDVELKHKLRVWITVTPPVITQIESRQNLNGRVTVSRTEMSDFFDCRGGKVPRTIIYVTESPKTGFLVRHWHSSDLAHVKLMKEILLFTFPLRLSFAG